jgi:hypothetical protein
MQTFSSTTPFGRRPFLLAPIARTATASDRPPETIVQKWQAFDAIRQGRGALGGSDRSLALPYVLLTFHSGTMLDGTDDIVVFPSNRNLARRANGMAETSLRRHLASQMANATRGKGRGRDRKGLRLRLDSDRRQGCRIPAPLRRCRGHKVPKLRPFKNGDS